MLKQKILAIYPSLALSEFGRNGSIRLQDEGQGPYIAAWNHPTLAQPTQEQLDAIVIDPDALPVPQSVTSLQFRREVRARGKMAQLKTWLSTASEDVQLYFEFTDRIRTTDPEFLEFVTLVGLTAEQVNQFFIAAAQR